MLTEGLYVMAFGMGLVFLALTVLMFAMMGLERAFRIKTPVEEPPAVVPLPTNEPPTLLPSPTVTTPSSHVPAEIAVAIAVAVSRMRAETTWASTIGIPSDVEDDPGLWDRLCEEGDSTIIAARGGGSENA